MKKEQSIPDILAFHPSGGGISSGKLLEGDGRILEESHRIFHVRRSRPRYPIN
jgi:hypothetical protein